MSVYLIIAAILFCLVLEMLYSGGEVALFASDINKLKNRAHQGSKASKRAVKLKARPEWYISTALIGTNLAIIIASTLATGSFDISLRSGAGRTNCLYDYDTDSLFNDYCPQCVS